MKIIATREMVMSAIKGMTELAMKTQPRNIITGFLEREVDTFFSDGYGDSNNRTTFFCVKGSPNPFFGWVRFFDDCEIESTTNWGKFIFKSPPTRKTRFIPLPKRWYRKR